MGNPHAVVFGTKQGNLKVAFLPRMPQALLQFNLCSVIVAGLAVLQLAASMLPRSTWSTVTQSVDKLAYRFAEARSKCRAN